MHDDNLMSDENLGDMMWTYYERWCSLYQQEPTDEGFARHIGRILQKMVDRKMLVRTADGRYYVPQHVN